MHAINAILEHADTEFSTSPSVLEDHSGSSEKTSSGDTSKQRTAIQTMTEQDPPTTEEQASSASAEPSPAAAAAAEEAARQQTEMEAKAIAEATASADASYVPTPSLLNASTPAPLLKQVDGPTVKGYTGKESTYVAKKVPVPLRGRLDVPIHISSGGSVVSYEITTVDYDISFGITAEREEGVTVVTEAARVNSHEEPITGKFLVGSVPCAIVFSFDNEYSWFKEKLVTYRITVRPPSRDNIIAGRRRRAKAALRAVTDDVSSAEKRLERATQQRTALATEIARMEKELAEKKKSLDVAQKEEGWLKDRVKLRAEQQTELRKRLDDGWDDEE